MTTATVGSPLVPPRPELWRITDRRTFLALRQDGQRVRRGPLTVTWLPPVAVEGVSHPRVAFAVGRAVGGAVVRNRIRRRLRAALRGLLTEGGLPAGSYLIGARTEVAQLPWPAVVQGLRDAVEAATEAPR